MKENRLHISKQENKYNMNPGQREKKEEACESPANVPTLAVINRLLTHLTSAMVEHNIYIIQHIKYTLF
jgi:hypothetical protein